MIILGLDPGSHITGYGVVHVRGNKPAHIDNGIIALSERQPLPQRLRVLYEDLQGVLDRFQPDAVAIEDVFFAKNARSALILGHARGAALLAVAQRNLTATAYTPTQVKLALTGHGAATKHQMQHMTRALLGLPEIAQEDAADALAVAICHAHSYKLSTQ